MAYIVDPTQTEGTAGNGGAQVSHGALAVRRDAPTALDANNTWIPLTTDANGKLWVNAEITGTVTANIAGTDTAADTHANPTTALITDAYNSVFNGTTWDRMRSGTALGSVLVNNGVAANLLATVTQGTSPWVVSLTSTTITGTVAVTQSTSPWVVSLASTTITGSVSVTQGTSPWVVSGTVSTTLPTVAMADATANPTIPQTAAFDMVFNGTSWDRVRSAGAIGVLSVGGAAASGVAVAGNPLLDGGRASAAVPTAVAADGQAVAMWLNRNGRVRVATDRPNLTGVYLVSTGNSTVTAAADGASSAGGGRFWIINPVGSAVIVSLRAIDWQVNSAGTALIALTAPIFTLERFTFTGTASGAQLTACKRDSNDAAEVGAVRTAATGMTITSGATGYGFVVPAQVTATVQYSPVFQRYAPAEDERIVLRAGEGLVVRQSTAGTALDVRAIQLDFTLEEFTALGNA